MWVWEGDRLAENFLSTAGVRPTPLHVADVNTGLETGMIDSFYDRRWRRSLSSGTCASITCSTIRSPMHWPC